MAWTILILSGVLEAVWAVALSESQGFKKRWPTVIFFVALFVSMSGLAYAMIYLPTGTAYAVWVGVGTVLAATWGMVTGAEKATMARILLLLLLISSVMGLRVVS